MSANKENILKKINISKKINQICIKLSFAHANPMDFTVEECEEWLIELSDTYLKRFKQKYIYEPKKEKCGNISEISSDDDMDELYGINDNSHVDNSSDDDSSDTNSLYKVNLETFFEDQRKKQTKQTKSRGFWDWINQDEDEVEDEDISSTNSNIEDSNWNYNDVYGEDSNRSNIIYRFGDED